MFTYLCHFSVRVLLSVLALKDGFSASFEQNDRGNVQEDEPVFIQLYRSNHNVARMDANGGCRAVDLVAVHSVDVDDPLFAVDLGNLSITTLVFSPHNQDLVVLSYWNRADLEIKAAVSVAATISQCP